MVDYMCCYEQTLCMLLEQIVEHGKFEETEPIICNWIEHLMHIYLLCWNCRAALKSRLLSSVWTKMTSHKQIDCNFWLDCDIFDMTTLMWQWKPWLNSNNIRHNCGWCDTDNYYLTAWYQPNRDSSNSLWIDSDKLWQVTAVIWSDSHWWYRESWQ